MSTQQATGSMRMTHPGKTILCNQQKNEEVYLRVGVERTLRSRVKQDKWEQCVKQHYLPKRNHSSSLFFSLLPTPSPFLTTSPLLWNSVFRCYIFPFLLCFSFLFFSQLFVTPPQTAILPFSWGWSWSLSPVQCQERLSVVHQTLCLESTWNCCHVIIYKCAWYLWFSPL